MTTKPEFTKAFCLEHAKAGAPYCCRDGRTAKVLKWDRNVNDYPLLGVMGKSDDPRTWTVAGSTTYGAHGAEYDGDLIMLPLGFIDGKPVWVGDHFITSSGLPCIATTASAGNFKGCSWPAPATVYPTTRMTAAELNLKRAEAESFDSSLLLVADAVLRHAIDAGQVVLPNSKIHDKNSSDRLARDCSMIDEVVATARDLAVAKIVRDEIYRKAIAAASDNKLAAIIAGVAK